MPRCGIHCCLLLICCGGFVSVPGCSQSAADFSDQPAAAYTPPAAFPVEVREAPVPPGIATGHQDAHGQLIELRCSACHSIRAANVATASAAELEEYHQGLKIAHGQLSCVSCHQASDSYASLKRADGRSLPFEESMQLCAQCHGPQYRDYQHGSHGGMTGHWDLSRGGRTRNHCLHCHDPHSPKFGIFTPAAGPRDRFPPAGSGETHD